MNYTISDYPQLASIEKYFAKKFPYFSKVISKRFNEFGEKWALSFEKELEVFFSNDEQRLQKASHGYGLFALDGLRLQKKFDKTLQYIAKRYEDVKGEVYLNRSYMFDLYLPGILLSHYLWPHHYNQKLWFQNKFIPLIKSQNVKTYCDVGVGTGFYSKEVLLNMPAIKGDGYDISEFSLEHTKMLIDRWGFGDHYRCHVQDIIANPPTIKADCAINVEVLEHLEDPITFLKALRKMVKDGAMAFITAAIDAPNMDHIYLYRDLDAVAKELKAANFKVIDAENFPAFTDPKPGETVPQNGSFIVQAI
ncbi:MAG: class I SAM-dependent methyltransferase [Oligoflexia bacterium]|nr:class I SAM-dependent methyltransferase [Oligoflexia bacterium]